MFMFLFDAVIEFVCPCTHHIPKKKGNTSIMWSRPNQSHIIDINYFHSKKKKLYEKKKETQNTQHEEENVTSFHSQIKEKMS